MTAITEKQLFQLHQAQRKANARYRYARRARPRPQDPRRQLANAAEREAAILLQLHGHTVTRAPRNYRYDLLADHTTIEVKAARWHNRYQCRWHNRAAFLCLLCCSKTPAWFVIPAAAIGTRQHLAIWSQDPAHYAGQWAPFREAWHLLTQERPNDENH